MLEEELNLHEIASFLLDKAFVTILTFMPRAASLY